MCLRGSETFNSRKINQINGSGMMSSVSQWFKSLNFCLIVFLIFFVCASFCKWWRGSLERSYHVDLIVFFIRITVNFSQSFHFLLYTIFIHHFYVSSINYRLFLRNKKYISYSSHRFSSSCNRLISFLNIIGGRASDEREARDRWRGNFIN